MLQSKNLPLCKQNDEQLNHYLDTLFKFTGDVRLSGGTLQHMGRLEVFHSGQWGTVCNDHFGLVNAEVVCKELGLGLLSGNITNSVR